MSVTDDKKATRRRHEWEEEQAGFAVLGGGLDVDPIATDEETAFDDVAMILLLFFMVSSLMVVISPEEEGPKRQVPLTSERADPGKIFQGVSHRLLITTATTGGVEIHMSGVGPVRESFKPIKRGPLLVGGSADIDYEYEAFEAAFQDLLADSRVPPAPSHAKPPVYLVNHFAYDADSDLVLTTWYALAKLKKNQDMAGYTRKVRFTHWRSQLRE